MGIHTFVSHGTKEYGEALIGEMKKQLRLTKKEFMDLIDCPMTKEKYLRILISKGHIEKWWVIKMSLTDKKIPNPLDQLWATDRSVPAHK